MTPGMTTRHRRAITGNRRHRRAITGNRRHRRTGPSPPPHVSPRPDPRHGDNKPIPVHDRRDDRRDHPPRR